jgi:hypothetical protein
MISLENSMKGYEKGFFCVNISIKLILLNHVRLNRLT